MKRFIILIFALMCGAAASQFPEFAQQYRQRVGGAVDALAQVTAEFDRDAAAEGLSREDALKTYANSPDDFLIKRGKTMTDTLGRHSQLTAHLKRLTEAAPFARLWVFAKERDMELSKATMNSFEPAVPVTVEGAAHAGGGLVGGWLILSILLSPFGRRKKRYA